MIRDIVIMFLACLVAGCGQVPLGPMGPKGVSVEQLFGGDVGESFSLSLWAASKTDDEHDSAAPLPARYWRPFGLSEVAYRRDGDDVSVPLIRIAGTPGGQANDVHWGVEWSGGTTEDGKGDDFVLGINPLLLEIIVEAKYRQQLDETRVLTGLCWPYGDMAAFAILGLAFGGSEDLGWYARIGTSNSAYSPRSVDWAVLHDSRDGTRVELIFGVKPWHMTASWMDLRRTGEQYGLSVDYRF